MCKKDHLPVLVAHRGYALRYPENSLQAIEAAFQSGADWAEFDVQLSADGIPFLLHDIDLQRTAGVPDNSLNMTWAQLQQVEINESDRFGKVFQGVCIPSLEALVALVVRWPEKQVFVELKRASLKQYGREVVLNAVLKILDPIRSRCVLISFDAEVLLLARQRGALRIGWVVESWNEAAHRQADNMEIDFLFCNYKKIPDNEKLWPGPWSWVLYDIASAELALDLGRRGADFVETGAVKELLSELQLREGNSIG